MLRDQLQKAQEKVTQDEEEEELARASEVVARLTAPISEEQKRRIRAALVSLHFSPFPSFYIFVFFILA